MCSYSVRDLTFGFHCRNGKLIKLIGHPKSQAESRVSQSVTVCHSASQSGRWSFRSTINPLWWCVCFRWSFGSLIVFSDCTCRVALPVSWTRTSSGIPDPVTLRSLLTASSSCAKLSVRCCRFLERATHIVQSLVWWLNAGSQGRRTEACAPADPLRLIIHRQGEGGEDSNLEVSWDETARSTRNQEVCLWYCFIMIHMIAYSELLKLNDFNEMSVPAARTL